MSKPCVLVLRAPGTNCDLETAYAFELAGAKSSRIHVNRLLENPGILDSFQIVCFPGGFSYGDDVAAGRILGNLVRHHLSEHLREFKEADKLILGICNGFQILLKSGLLLEDDAKGIPATLSWNDSGRYIDRWVKLDIEDDTKCIFLRGLDSITLPIAHAEGKFQSRDSGLFKSLESSGQLPLRYETGSNHNGSQGNVAGVCDTSGRVFGLMPHPERYFDPLQHPRWTRSESHLKRSYGDGLPLFKNAVNYFKD